MTGKPTPVMFVTANVGSIFEEPSRMLQVWADEFLSTVTRLDPKFIALHCQEVGGKNYEKSMQYVQNFVKLLVESEELRLFDKVRIYLDEDFASADKFTALGNFYFIHESVSDVLIYDFNTQRFVDIEGCKIHREDIETASTKEKSKFPLEYFPECKWSRKGFLRTRWSLNGTVFDLVNIHLFHDASNFVAIESFPSEYSETRRQALIYTLDRFQNDEHELVPIFMFGDFNFRTDTKGVVKRLSEGLFRSLADGDSDDSTVEYCDNDEKVLLLGKKMFSHLKHQDIFCGTDAEWLREFDKEMESFKEQLFEFTITFQPSYPFEEGETDGTLYMKTRCPAWCDRVLLTKDALSLVKDVSNSSNLEYSLMGSMACMGDHKPVYLKFEIKERAATEKETIKTMRLMMADCDDNGAAGDRIIDNGIITDTGQEITSVDRLGLVKRVNSASLVENKTKRDDWKTNRCNSDVSWNPATSDEMARMNKIRKPLFRAGSKIRLISMSNINISLPRLTSHHSSSDEEWFEVVGDDDVLESPGVEKRLSIKCEPEVVNEVTDDKKELSTKPKNSLSIWKRLIKEHHESHVDVERPHELKSTKGLEEQISPQDVTETKQTSSKRQNQLVFKTQSLLKRVRKGSSLTKNDELTGSWESIDLSGSKPKAESVPSARNKRACCILQ